MGGACASGQQTRPARDTKVVSSAHPLVAGQLGVQVLAQPGTPLRCLIPLLLQPLVACLRIPQRDLTQAGRDVGGALSW